MSLEVKTVTVCSFTHIRMDTEKERKTTCRRWPATGSSELICGERERGRERERERGRERGRERRESKRGLASESANGHFI